MTARSPIVYRVAVGCAVLALAAWLFVRSRTSRVTEGVEPRETANCIDASTASLAAPGQDRPTLAISPVAAAQDEIAAATMVSSRTAVEPQLEAALILGRAVDERGDALAQVELFAICGTSNRRTTTDASGRFELLRPGPPAGAATSNRLLAQPPAEDGSFTLVLRHRDKKAELVLRQSLAEPRIELGDVVFGEPRLVAAGIVVGETGSPIAGAHVRARSASEGRGSAREGTDVRYDARMTDEHGAFELRSYQVPASVWLVAADPDGLEGNPVLVLAGTQDVRLTVPASGAVTGTVLCEDTGLARELELSIERLHDLPMHYRRHDLSLKRDFTLRGLPAGSYCITLRLRSPSEPVSSRSDIEVRAGETTDVGAIDARGKVHWIRLHVLGAERKLLTNATAALESDPDQEFESAAFPGSLAGGQSQFAARPPHFRSDESNIAIPTTRTTLKLVVQAPVYRPQTVEAHEGVQDVQLVPMPRVHARLADGLAIPQGWKLRVRLDPTNRRGPSSKLRTAATLEPPARDVSLFVPEPGEYRVWCELIAPDDSRHSPRDADSDTLVVANTDEERSFVLPLTSENVAEQVELVRHSPAKSKDD